MMEFQDNLGRLLDGTINSLNPVLQVFGAIVDNEIYTYKTVMEQEDYRDFITAMVKEIKSHEENGHWIVQTRKECGYPKTILAIWSFKQKRLPDGTLNKHKACLCAHGGMQQWGFHYWETFAPVVNWLSVWLIVVLSIIDDLPMRAIYFVFAFPQAKLDVTIFMELPPGFQVEEGKKGEHIIELKNLSTV